MEDAIGFKTEFVSSPVPEVHPRTYLPGQYPDPPSYAPSYSHESFSAFPPNTYPSYPPVEHHHSSYPPVEHHHPTYPQPGITAGGHKAYYWIDWSSDLTIPPSAIHGGVDRDGNLIYIGRAYHEGDWIPAKVIPDRHVAYVAYGGGEHIKHNFQVLCQQRFDWIPSSNGHIPAGAIEGGRTVSGEPLYIGRVWHDGAQTVGKVHSSQGCCFIPYGNEELSFCDYEILVIRH